MSNPVQEKLKAKLVAFKGGRSIRKTARVLGLNAKKINDWLREIGFPRRKDLSKLSPHLGTNDELAAMWREYQDAKHSAPKTHKSVAKTYGEDDIITVIEYLIRNFSPKSSRRAEMNSDDRNAYEAACRLGVQVLRD